MKKDKTALLLVGFQNDYFHQDGILRGVVEETALELKVLENTLKVIEEIPASLPVFTTPILFSEDYSEIIEEVGILKAIKELGAFKRGTLGGETIKQFKALDDRIIEVPGKHGLNAFIDTDLENELRSRNIETVILAGCVCSICIDSTGRSAFEKGFEVIMLSDCITGRTMFEQRFYCEEVFPLYAKVISSTELIEDLND